MKIINIDLGTRSYPIYVGKGLLSSAELIFKHLPHKKIAIVTNTKVANLYLANLVKMLSVQKEVIPIILADGEEHKNQKTLGLIYDALLQNKADRNIALVALGGGVIGDITGFAAATFMRGVDFIQIPTTLLAQVDSSVGGKTGINHELGKNMIGSFYQPKCVIADVTALDTLDDRQLSAGMAEVIKYGLIRDYNFFEWLEKNMENVMNKNSDLMIEVVIRSCQNKADIVEADELESGIRAILNLGHTFGHAIEAATGYGKWLHGEAVAVGMIMAAYLSQEMKWLEEGDVVRIKNLISQANLPLSPPKIEMHQFLELMHLDKKTKNGQINLVLQQGIGKAILTEDYDSKKLEDILLGQRIIN